MSDTQERPVSQLVKNLTAMIRDYKPTANVGVDVHCLTVIRDALQASEEREQRLRALERDGHDVDFCKILAILGDKP
jgi:hypothetical protein